MSKISNNHLTILCWTQTANASLRPLRKVRDKEGAQIVTLKA